ncbi:hypothetical protein VCR6J2_240038 [Vibrio coralliirubri]|nr:hypothetical protein VCR6J2_240038 [Vibrio coralliirubri]
MKRRIAPNSTIDQFVNNAVSFYDNKGYKYDENRNVKYR